MPGSLPLNPYNMILLLLFILLVILGGLLLRRFFARRKKKGSPFERTEDLFPGHERNFLRMLDQALGEGYRVFGKIQAGVLLKPKKSLTKRDRLDGRRSTDRPPVRIRGVPASGSGARRDR